MELGEQVLQDQPCVINCPLSLHPVCNESWGYKQSYILSTAWQGIQCALVCMLPLVEHD